jgi:hypothetical protein
MEVCTSHQVGVLGKNLTKVNPQTLEGRAGNRLLMEDDPKSSNRPQASFTISMEIHPLSEMVLSLQSSMMTTNTK